MLDLSFPRAWHRRVPSRLGLVPSGSLFRLGQALESRCLAFWTRPMEKRRQDLSEVLNPKVLSMKILWQR